MIHETQRGAVRVGTPVGPGVPTMTEEWSEWPKSGTKGNGAEKKTSKGQRPNREPDKEKGSQKRQTGRTRKRLQGKSKN